MKTSSVTVDTTVCCVTIIVLQQLVGPQLCKEPTAPKENNVELNIILDQKFKFLNTIACSLVIALCSKQITYSNRK